MDTKELIGKTVNEVRLLANDEGLNTRIVKIDGNSLIVTSDFRVDRLNLEVEKGLVVNIYNG